ncbi:MAG: asparaginase [Actinomycetota bacterium]
MPGVPLVRVVRSGVEESVHFGSVAVADVRGRLVARAGDPGRVAFARSSMKPLQAAVSLWVADTELPDAEVAVMCASHNGEPVHVDAVREILRRAGLDPGALRCPPDRPLHPEDAAGVPEPAPLFHNCSGKHAGMLLACVRSGWDLVSYQEPDHPLQRRVLEAVTTAAGQDPVAVGVDGCGVPVHALPLSSMATLYARLVSPDVFGPLRPHAERAVGAMTSEPYLVAGRDRVCTAVMQVDRGLVVKVGAEGLICAALRDRGVGVAIKVDDGNARAQAPALIRALVLLEALPPRLPEALTKYAHPPVLGGGRPVGELLAEFELQAA